MKQLLLILFIFLQIIPGYAKKDRFNVFKEEGDQRATLKNSKPFSVFYEKVSWNENPTQIDQGYLYIRDRQTGELIEVFLTETEPNSSLFSVEYPVGSFKQAQIEAEIYSPPQSMLQTIRRMEMMNNLIRDQTIKRKPFLMRSLREKGYVIDVFDDREAAISAYNHYRKQLGLTSDVTESTSIVEVANQEKPVTKKVIDTSTLQSLFLANETNQDATNAKNLEMREVLKGVEQKRREGVKLNAKNWSKAETEKNKKLATDSIKLGVDALKNQNFKESLDGFYKASDLAPDNEDIYQQYGVSLFRDKKFNQAIVVLDLSNPSNERLAEKNFYLAMSYFQLKDYGKATEYFDKVIATNDPSFAVTASFYKGSSLIEMGEYEKSKLAFQYVLDNSKDPKLDERAEKFIDYSNDRKRLQDKRSNWFFIDGVLGLMYDSNITLANDQVREQGTATGAEGVRLLAQATTKMRPFYRETDEISVLINLMTLKSFDTSFASNPLGETADPTLIGIDVPWTHRGTLGQKGYFFDLAPGYETIMMDLDGTGTATITNSMKLNFFNTLVINKNWIAKGDWGLSSNDSNILGDETSADSIAGSLRLSSIFILNKDLERYLIPDFAYRINDAEAANYAFNRVDLGVTYITSIFDKWMWNSRFGYFLANYESTRTDNNYTFSTGVSTRINSHWNWNLMGSYIINDSTTNQYKKFNILSNVSFSY